MKKTRILGALAAAAALALAGCSGPGETADTAGTVELQIFAAASLNEAFPVIYEEVFAPENPNVEVSFNFGGSSGLVDQMAEGAPADAFFSANKKTMDTALDKGLVAAPVSYAANTMVLVTPPDNPGGVTGFDASLDGAKLVVCEASVPCGSATEKLAGLAGISISPVSEEQSVTDVLGKVESGEADAGLVYITDALSAGDAVNTIEIAQADDVVNDYQAAVTLASQNPEAAQAFVDAVLSEDGQKILQDRFHFLAPLG